MANTWHVTTREFDDGSESCLKYALDSCECGDTILCEWKVEQGRSDGGTCLMGDYERHIEHTDAKSDVYVYIEQTEDDQRIGWDSFKIYNDGELHGVFAVGFLDYANGSGSAGGCGPCRNVAIVGKKIDDTTRIKGYVPVVVSSDSEDDVWCYFDKINTGVSCPLNIMFFTGHIDKDNIWVIWQDFTPDSGESLRNIAAVGQHPAEGGTGTDIHLFYGCRTDSIEGTMFQRVAHGGVFQCCEIYNADVNTRVPEIRDCQLNDCIFREGYDLLENCRLYDSEFYGTTNGNSICENCYISDCEFHNDYHTISSCEIYHSNFNGITMGSDNWSGNYCLYCVFSNCSAGESPALIRGDIGLCTFENCKYDYTYMGRRFGGNTVVNSPHRVIVFGRGQMFADDYDKFLVVNDSRDYTIEVYGTEEGGKDTFRVRDLECSDKSAIVTFFNRAHNVYKDIQSENDRFVRFEGFLDGPPPDDAVYGNIFHMCGW